MKKIFISVPMHDRAKADIEDDIKRLKGVCKGYFGDEEVLEFVDNHNFRPKKGVKHPRPYCLGKAIQLLADCDLMVVIDRYDDCLPAYGCQIERDVCNYYDIPILHIATPGKGPSNA